MEDQFSKNIKSNLTNLGIYQIIGGAIGLLFIIWTIFKSPISPIEALLIYLIIVSLFLYSVFCGILCIKVKKNALNHSLANQILQVFSFAIMGFAFKYVAGFYLTIGLDLADSFNLHFGAGLSKIDFNINNEKKRLEVDFNLVALALIYWIDKLLKKVKEDAAIRQASSIGYT